MFGKGANAQKKKQILPSRNLILWNVNVGIQCVIFNTFLNPMKCQCSSSMSNIQYISNIGSRARNPLKH